MSYLCPADHFAVSFKLGAMEDLDAGDGLHGLAINGADDSDEVKDEKTVCERSNETGPFCKEHLTLTGQGVECRCSQCEMTAERAVW